MKKIVMYSTVSLLLLSGCGGSDNSDSIGTANHSSYITIKGEGINQTLNFDDSQLTYKISAIGNQPITSASFANKNGSDFSVVELNHGNKAKLAMLFKDFDTQDVKSIFCFPLYDCSSNTSYSIKELNQKKHIQVIFKDAPNQYYRGDASELKDFNGFKSVLITGELNYFAQSNWPIFQTNRFPIVKVQGKVIYDSEEYNIESYAEFDTRLEGKLYWTDKELVLKKDDKTIFLLIRKYHNTYSENAISIRVSDGTDTYTISDLANEIWSHSNKEFELNLDNIILKSDAEKIKTLSANVYVPFDQYNLILNQSTQLVPRYKNTYAQAINDQKMYQIYFENYGELTINQEIKGHLSLVYTQGEDTVLCGDRNTSCKGLSVDHLKQNFTFNSVKIGSDTINGNFYFAGVFQ
ncbi:MULTISPECIES: hypothetical protein [Acinetobacter]|uniref:hypothetical protein n=1 Tax=Acinetobacter TaxID=469 RepID=UPI0002AEB125|nr:MULTISPECIES: hypothetical protein [Acinetobacter]ELW82347.1 hypothetical protein ACINWC743_1648 [Acinetobacter sp. WC-743]MBJ8425745.1 hypothetical protein [Acinetobacter bereziniae]MBJ8474544.1 hypothetical protein [Acinetobacter bereziniae]